MSNPLIGMDSFQINLLDLRSPKGFVFFSISGYITYFFTYAMVASFDRFIDAPCQNALINWDKVISDCGLKGWFFVYPLFYFISSYIIIVIFKQRHWSSNAIFNNTSIIIIFIAFIVILRYLGGGAASISEDRGFYYTVLCIAVITLLLMISYIKRCVSYLNSGDKNIQQIIEILKLPNIGNFLGVLWLGFLYFILSFGFYFFAFELLSL